MSGWNGTLVLDFDGTVCLGDDPVRLYCEEATASLSPAQAARVTAGLERFLEGEEVPEAAGAQDGYQVVQRLVFLHGVTTSATDRAYRLSRRRFDAGEGHTWLPDGLAEELSVVRGCGIRVVLVTNAPREGVLGFAERTGLAPQLDAVVAEAGKPAGMSQVLRRLLEEGQHPPARLLSVGDVWANDIEPAALLGCRTGYVDRFGLAAGPADIVTSQIGDMLTFWRRWGCQAPERTTDS